MPFGKLALLGEVCALAIAVRLRSDAEQNPIMDAVKHRPLGIPKDGGEDGYFKQPSCSPPELCKPPFNCQEGHYDTHQVLASMDGRANYRSWCGNELPFRNEAGAIKCGLGLLSEYGPTILESNPMHNPGSNQGGLFFKSIFAHHCFAQGFCDDTNVTEKTTVEESEQLCDQRYGRQNWTSVSGEEIKKLWHFDTDELVEDQGLHLSPKLERLYAMSGCAQGVHHCDVHWCKTYFCPEGDWRAFAKQTKIMPGAFSYSGR